MGRAPEPVQQTPTLPLGTHVVTRVPSQGAAGGGRPAGMVGVVVAAPDASEPRYRVRFADGDEALLARHALRTASHSSGASVGTSGPCTSSTSA